mmetsp:Transcript_8316/g.14317  ORF Transcript_8316/g.14317 Transcript_8316/m.14317 type:complete len:116 (-) Transcript_8316:73-420(-)
MVVYELLIQGLPWTYEEDTEKVLSEDEILQLVVVERRRPFIPEWVPHEMKRLLGECWSHSPTDRPSMGRVLATLEGMEDKEWERIQVCAYQLVDSSTLTKAVASKATDAVVVDST